VALLMNKYHRVFRLAKPPFAVQRLLFGIIAPFAWLMGLRATYPRYLDR
jgi:hypothetical protein